MKQRKKILVAEDQIDNYILVNAYLKKDYDTINEVNGEDTVNRIKKDGDSIDLVLMDIKMPRLDGLSATRKLRELGFDKPIIALTAYAYPEEKKAAYEAGCDHYLTKPISKDKLIDTINVAFDEDYHCD
jgi:CheY-like chemotaxis protein